MDNELAMAKGAGLGLLCAVIILVFLSAVAIDLDPDGNSDSSPYELTVVFGTGSLHINDAGRSHGGFEYAAEYSVEVSQGCNGTVRTNHIAVLDFTLQIGLGDALSVHELRLKLLYDRDRNEVTLANESATIVLEKVAQDLIWNHAWDGYYVASWGGDAPEEEVRGQISPEIFGLPSHYYVELRLWATVVPPAV